MVMKQKLVIEEIQESTVVTDVEANSVHEESVETIAQSVPLAQSSQEKLKVVAPTKLEEAKLELYYIGQLHGTYLLAQNEEGLLLLINMQRWSVCNMRKIINLT